MAVHLKELTFEKFTIHLSTGHLTKELPLFQSTDVLCTNIAEISSKNILPTLQLTFKKSFRILQGNIHFDEKFIDN